MSIPHRRPVLQRENLRPKKHLGQNFLTSIPARMAIVAAGDIKKGEIVLEIGPGKGMLTTGLLDAAARVIALEKDTELIPYLTEHFKDYKNFTLLLGDALTYEPTFHHYKLIANIPYYITGAILSRYLTLKNPPAMMVVLVQKEVAERIVARDGKHSLLSLSVQVYGTPSIVYRVSRGSFYPIPKVDSAVLKIENISPARFKNQYHEAMFFKVLHAGFAHKRKFLIRNLEIVTGKGALLSYFHQLKIKDTVRAEDVTLDTWISLSLLISLKSSTS